MNRKEFLKLVVISPVALVINRILNTFKSKEDSIYPIDEIKVIQRTTKFTHTWKLSLPFGTILISRYQWGKKKHTAYYIKHGFGSENPHTWVILPESEMVADMTTWETLAMSQEDADRYTGVGKKWIPGHFEDI